MPIYEYECKKCLQRFEVKQSFTADGKTKCGSCGAEARKVFSPVPIFFKGSGFYVTDHAATGKKTDPGKSATTTTDAAPSPVEDKKGAVV